MNFAFFVEVLTQYEMKLFLVLCTDGFIYFLHLNLQSILIEFLRKMW